jgi:hypothetical protein
MARTDLPVMSVLAIAREPLIQSQIARYAEQDEDIVNSAADEYEAVEIPIQHDMAMLIIIPDRRKLSSLIGRLQSVEAAVDDSLFDGEIALTIPMLDTDVSFGMPDRNHNVRSALARMEIPQAAVDGGDDPVTISRLFDGLVETFEDTVFSKPSALTAIDAHVVSKARGLPHTVRADRPFIWMIRGGSVRHLFSGIIHDPSQ